MTGRDALDRGGLPGDVRTTLRALSVVALASPVFEFAPTGDAYRWLDVSPATIALFVVAGLLGLLASTGRPALAVVAGVLCLAGAGVRFVTLALASSSPIGGSGSTMTFLAGLGLGFVLLGIVHRLPVAQPTA